MALVINFIAFQIGWFAVVLSAAAYMPWLGVAIAASVVTLHLARAERPRGELTLLAICGVAGALWDSLLVTLGWVSYPSGIFLNGFAPFWIIMMWLLFATTLNVSLGWLKGRPLLAAGFGLVGGPLSYMAGQKLDAIVLIEPFAAITALAIGWALMMPLLLVLAERYNGVKAVAADASLETS